MSAERNRYRTIQVDPFTGLPVRWENTSEGKKVFAAFWLSMVPSIGSWRSSVVNIPYWLQVPGKEKKTPMAFIFGEQDFAARGLAAAAVPRLGGKENSIIAMPIKGSKLAGNGLLNPNLPVTNTIVKGVAELLQKRVANDWVTQDTDRLGYVWYFESPRAVYIAKTDNEKAFRAFRIDHFRFINEPLPPT
jgi:hypothetical protein